MKIAKAMDKFLEAYSEAKRAAWTLTNYNSTLTRLAVGEYMPEEFTAADLTRQTPTSLAEPNIMAQINEFIVRAEGLFREGKEFLINLASISTNPTFKKVVGEKLGVKPPALPDSSMQRGPTATPQIDYEKQFTAMIEALNQFKALKGDITLTQLIEWLQANKTSVISGMQLKG